MESHPTRQPTDQAWFREVLGCYPTGVTAITATLDGKPVGMAVGSFTSLSLDPPLVLFCPAKTSTTWPAIEQAGAFCVNVLSEHQEQVCRAMAAKAPDKFGDVAWRPGQTGSPVLEGAAAWIECVLERVVDGGDHWIVLGRVLELGREEGRSPLVFLGGGYGTFTSRSHEA
jgi:flavin reductase (DIM6/NTAB) family NADH-FMN oxidoreductase RutF